MDNGPNYVRVLLREESVEGEHFRCGDADPTPGVAAVGIGGTGVLQCHLLAFLIDAEEWRGRRRIISHS